MTYGKLKKTKKYKKANGTSLSVNGEEPVDEMYYPEELDHLTVIGIGYMANGDLNIDVVCNNWEHRTDVGWVAQG